MVLEEQKLVCCSEKKQSDFAIPVAINCLNSIKIRIALAHLRRKTLEL
jgi:hypothetical protein